MKSPSLLICICTLILAGSATICSSQQAPDRYGLIAPWDTAASVDQTSPQQRIGSRSPAGLGEPVDPITGLPLRMTSLANSNGTGLTPDIADDTRIQSGSINSFSEFPGSPPTQQSDSIGQPASQIHRPLSPPGPILRPDSTAPALPAQPQRTLTPPSIIDPFQRQEPYQSRHFGSGPTRFDGGIEVSGSTDQVQFPALPETVPIIPLPQLDPPLSEVGNGDGELDWIDLIEEYAGRATRSDVPQTPALTPPHHRSWLRLEHWEAEATADLTDSSGFGLATFYGGATIGLGKIRGVTITPSAALHEAYGTARKRLEEQLYDFQIKAAWMHQFDGRWRMRAEVGAGLFSDFDIDETLHALRLNGMWLFTCEASPDIQVVMGAAFLNLDNQEFYPVGGIVWQPSDHLQLEILFPEWKLASFVKKQREGEIWSYLGGGFYGRTWRVQRSSGAEDLATYSNWRVHVGYEKRHVSGITCFGELGYVFDRSLRYRSNVGDFDADGLAFARVGINF